MALPINQAQTIDKLVTTAFSNKADLVRFLGPIVKLLDDPELKKKIDAHFELEADLVKEISEALQKKKGLKHFVVLPTGKDDVKFYKSDKGVALFEGNQKDQMVYGFTEEPQKIDDSPERINEVIRKYCSKHFDIPKDYRLTDQEINIILEDEYPSLTFDDIVSQHVLTSSAVSALRKQIPSFDDSEAEEKLAYFADSPDFEEPFLDAKYPVTLNVPLVIDRAKEEAYVQCVDPVSLIEAINLTPKELYSMAIKSTQKEPCLTFLTQASMDNLLDYGNNRYNDVFIPDPVTLPKGTHFGVFDPDVTLPSGFGRTLLNPITLPEESCYMRADVGELSAKNRCCVPEDFFLPEDQRSSKTINVSSFDDFRNAVSDFAKSGFGDAVPSGTAGSWSITEKKYHPPLWVVSYNDTPVVVRYHYNDIERVANISDKDFSKICDVITNQFCDNHMADFEATKIKGKTKSYDR